MEANDEIRMRELQAKLEALEKEFHDYKQIEQEKENKRLRTALITAGGVIMALLGFLWAEVLWPAIKLGVGGKP